MSISKDHLKFSHIVTGDPSPNTATFVYFDTLQDHIIYVKISPDDAKVSVVDQDTNAPIELSTSDENTVLKCLASLTLRNLNQKEF